MNYREARALAERLTILAVVDGSPNAEEYSYIKRLRYLVNCHVTQATLRGWDTQSIDDPGFQTTDPRRHTRTLLQRLARAARVSNRLTFCSASPLADDLASFQGYPWVRP